jgi:hypothetical protein
MNKLLSFFCTPLIICVILVSCSGRNSQIEGDDTSSWTEKNTEINNENTDFDNSEYNLDLDLDDEPASASTGGCEELLKNYEKFLNNYIPTIKKMKNNTNVLSVMMDYSALMNEAADWTAKTSYCAADARYASKFFAIQMKIANTAAGL